METDIETLNMETLVKVDQNVADDIELKGKDV
jgi:hypothetical protein